MPFDGIISIKSKAKLAKVCFTEEKKFDDEIKKILNEMRDEFKHLSKWGVKDEGIQNNN